ncbi:MAG TPA: hypothetical protein VH274_08140 [Mycobacteriales bacterium]|nr:hypothetical protein [Mycobacteriales bacterium]
MTRHPLARQGARIGVPLGVALAIVGFAAAPALAATNVSVSAGGGNLSDGDVLDHNATVSVKGTTDATASSRQLKLSVDPPGRSSDTLKTGTASPLQNGQLSASFDTSCPDWSDSPCVEAVNGTYTFTFQAGSATSSSSVQLRVPPAAPTGFQAGNTGTVVSFTWNPNDEPDLMGYDIVDGSGSDVTPGGMDAGSVCDSSGCGVNVDFGSSAQGTTRSFSLVALRHTSPGSGGSISSPDSASQSVTFPAPPPPPPSSSPGDGSTGSGSGGSGGSTGGVGGGATGGSGSGAGGSAGSGGHDARQISGKHPAADLRSSLPTVTAAGAPDLPSVLTEVKPLPQGSYKPVLPYGDQVVKTKKPQVAEQHNAQQVLQDFRKVLDIGALWRSLAGAVVLMLAAAHLRAFVERVDVD